MRTRILSKPLKVITKFRVPIRDQAEDFRIHGLGHLFAQGWTAYTKVGEELFVRFVKVDNFGNMLIPYGTVGYCLFKSPSGVKNFRCVS